MTRTRPWTSSQEQRKTWSTQDWIIRGKTRAAETKRQQKAEEGVLTPRTGTSRAEQAAEAAAPRTGASGDKWLPDAPDGRIRDGTRSTGSPQSGSSGDKRRRNATDWIKQHQPPHPGLDHPGTKGGQTPRTGAAGVGQTAAATAPTTQKWRDTWWADAREWRIWGRTRRSGHNHRGRRKMVCRPGQECPGRINQKGSPPPGLEHPGESGGQRRRKQEAETKVVQRRRQERKQRKGQG